MKTWHIVAGGAALAAAWYLFRGTPPVAYVTPRPPVATGPATEGRTGRTHFTGGVATPTAAIVASGPSSETQSGRGHF
jgi:hypothetical protein